MELIRDTPPPPYLLSSSGNLNGSYYSAQSCAEFQISLSKPKPKPKSKAKQ